MTTVPVFYGIWIGKPTERSIQLLPFYAASMINLGFRRRLVRGDDHDRRRSQSERANQQQEIPDSDVEQISGSEVQTETFGNALEAECYSEASSDALISLFLISITSMETLSLRSRNSISHSSTSSINGTRRVRRSIRMGANQGLLVIRLPITSETFLYVGNVVVQKCLKAPN